MLKSVPFIISGHVANGAYGRLDERRLYAYLSADLPTVMAPGAPDFIAYLSTDGILPRAFAKRKVITGVCILGGVYVLPPSWRRR